MAEMTEAYYAEHVLAVLMANQSLLNAESKHQTTGPMILEETETS